MKTSNYIYVITTFIVVVAVLYFFDSNSLGKRYTHADIEKALMSKVEQDLYENKQILYEYCHSVASMFGGRAKDVKLTYFNLSPSYNTFSCEFTILWETALTPQGFTTFRFRGVLGEDGKWQLAKNSLSLISTNGMLDNDFFYNAGYALGIILAL